MSEPKFKVGDRARVCASGGGYGADQGGAIVVIIRTPTTGSDLYTARTVSRVVPGENHNGLHYWSRELEEIPEDVVVHPSHYNWIPGIECRKVTQWFNFNLGNVIKYVWRAGKKDSTTALEDLQKARQYIDFEIERLLK